MAGRRMILPPVVVALDVETTGLSSVDRIVSIGMVRLNTASLARGDLEVDVLHAFCNPGRPSHPRARAVHGIGDRFLAQQAPFSAIAEDVVRFLTPATIILAHNAAFDRRFLQQEPSLSDRLSSLPPWLCTLRLSGANLEHACAHLGLRRKDTHHGALEDAWLALMVYLAHNDVPHEILCELPDSLSDVV